MSLSCPGSLREEGLKPEASPEERTCLSRQHSIENLESLYDDCICANSMQSFRLEDDKGESRGLASSGASGLLHGSNISDAFQEILNLSNRSQSDEYLKIKELVTTGPNLNLVNAMAGPSPSSTVMRPRIIVRLRI